MGIRQFLRSGNKRIHRGIRVFPRSGKNKQKQILYFLARIIPKLKC